MEYWPIDGWNWQSSKWLIFTKYKPDKKTEGGMPFGNDVYGM
jgi:hypothetical protein